MNKEKAIKEMKKITVGMTTDILFNKVYFDWNTDLIYFGETILEISDSKGGIYLIDYNDIYSIDGIK
ncbi:MAG: hypothetical protein ACRC57_00465 [Sarcina sp.]